MPFFFFDPTMVLIIPPLLFALWAQYKVKSTYTKYDQVGTRVNITGAETAQLILRDGGMSVVQGEGSANNRTCGLEAIPGQLTDHYDPRAHTLRLSENIFHGRSVAALGIAAHEVGHALQHANLYAPLALRNFVYPVCNIGSTLAFPLFFIGMFVPHLSIGGVSLMTAAIVMFSLSVFFTMLTLPVEFNASSRAIKALSHGGYLTDDELRGAKKVLTAAALTYVAAAAMAIMQLVRMLLIANDRD